ncbi:hypothetical protein C8R44DRAFT_778873 [Mycena epipterygia]|nr:hypothetical protein C8R44DRAFT_778873 [Mycena epipterygia]
MHSCTCRAGAHRLRAGRVWCRCGVDALAANEYAGVRAARAYVAGVDAGGCREPRAYTARMACATLRCSRQSRYRRRNGRARPTPQHRWVQSRAAACFLRVDTSKMVHPSVREWQHLGRHTRLYLVRSTLCMSGALRRRRHAYRSRVCVLRYDRRTWAVLVRSRCCCESGAGVDSGQPCMYVHSARVARGTGSASALLPSCWCSARAPWRHSGLAIVDRGRAPRVPVVSLPEKVRMLHGCRLVGAAAALGAGCGCAVVHPRLGAFRQLGSRVRRRMSVTA